MLALLMVERGRFVLGFDVCVAKTGLEECRFALEAGAEFRVLRGWV